MVKKKWLISILLIFLILIPTIILIFQEKEEVKENLQTKRFKTLDIVSAKKPIDLHLWFEIDVGYLYLIDSSDRTKTYKSIDKGDNWTQVDVDPDDSSGDNKSRDYGTYFAWHDRANTIIYFIDWDNVGDDLYPWKIDYSTDTVTDLGSISKTDITPIDIFLIGADIFIFTYHKNAGQDQFEIFKWVDPNWVSQDTYNLANIYFGVFGVVIGDLYYFRAEDAANDEIYMYSYTHATTTITQLLDVGNYDVPDERYQGGISYDGTNLLSFVVKDGADHKLITYNINDVSAILGGVYNIALMLDRNTASSSIMEKAFSIDASEIVYEQKIAGIGVRVLQDCSGISDAVLIAITDNFLMNDDGDMFEFTDVTNEISTIRYTDGIMGVEKKGIFTAHPDFHINWSIGDSIKIYDNNDVLEFHGLIIDKNRDSRGIYIYKIDSFTNEIYRTPYENAYTADDSDTKQKDIIDNACDFCYRSSSIVGTATTYDYAYNRDVIYLFWLTRFLERQVPYIEPDGKIWTKAYDGLTATGKSWDIEDNSQEVFLVDIPSLEEKLQGFFEGNSGITRNTIRYKNNTTTIRPVAATRNPIEQLKGILPLREFRDPKLEAVTEANQLGDNRYNIWSIDTIFLGLRIEGQGYLQPGKTIEIENTGEITIAQDDFLIISFERDPKNDVYIRMILSDNIIFPSEFSTFHDTSRLQIHTASVQTLENQAVIAAGAPDHNDLNGLNAGDVYEHISAAQKAALHAIYTDAEADARIAIHDAIVDAHHAATVAGDLNHNDLANIDAADIKHITAAQLGALHATYTDAEAVTAMGVKGAGNPLHHDIQTKYTAAEVDARIVVQNTHPAGTTDIAMDALIATHKGLPNDHHVPTVKYTDAEADARIAAANHDVLQNPNGNADEQHLTAAEKADYETHQTAAEVQTLIDATNHTNLQNPNGEADEQHMTAAQIAALHAVVTGTPPIAITGQLVEIKNDAAAVITEIDTGVLSELDTTIPTSKTVFDAIGGQGLVVATYLADQNVGIGNRTYNTLVLEGEAPASALTTYQQYNNNSATDFYMTFGITVPITKVVNGTTYYLHVDRVQIGIDTADGDDYVSQVTMESWSDYTTYATHLNDGTNRTAANEYNYDFVAVDMNGKERVIVLLNCFSSTANQLRIAYVRIRYYYDT